MSPSIENPEGKAVLRVVRNGDSLAVNITRQARLLGIQAGDYVVIAVRKVDSDGFFIKEGRQ